MRLFVVAIVFAAGCLQQRLPIPTGKMDQGVSSDRDLAVVELDLGVADLGLPSDLAVPNLGLPTPDLASTDGGGSVFVHPPVPAHFASPANTALPSGFNGYCVAVGDVTGDQRGDVVVGGYNINAGGFGTFVLVYPQSSTGTLGSPSSYSIASGGASQVAIADMNGDGRKDVIVSRQSDVGIFYQDSTGALGTVQPVSVPLNGGFFGTPQIATADLNLDGRADLIVTGGSATAVAVWLQLANGTLAAPKTYPCPSGSCGGFAIGDFNNDGRPDIAMAGAGTTHGCWLPSQSSGFGAYVPLSFPYIPMGFGGGDLNNDGLDDLVLGYDNSSAGGGPQGMIAIAAQANNALGSFVATRTAAQAPATAIVFDINQDGYKDVIVDDQPSIYYQDALGRLTAEQNGTGGGTLYPNRMAIGDLNNDTKPDIAFIASQLSILYQQ